MPPNFKVNLRLQGNVQVRQPQRTTPTKVKAYGCDAACLVHSAPYHPDLYAQPERETVVNKSPRRPLLPSHSQAPYPRTRDEARPVSNPLGAKFTDSDEVFYPRLSWKYRAFCRKQRLGCERKGPRLSMPNRKGRRQQKQGPDVR